MRHLLLVPLLVSGCQFDPSGGLAEHDSDGGLVPPGDPDAAVQPPGDPDAAPTSRCPDGAAVDDLCHFARRRALTFDASGTDKNHDRFVVLVVLDAQRIDYSIMQPDGDDLRFVEPSTGALIPYEVERWQSGGVSHVWVQVPRIDQASTTDFIWMYYGAPGVAGAQSAPQTWSEYELVYHMASVGVVDSSPNAHTGQAFGTGIVEGVIGEARSFTAANLEYIDTNCKDDLPTFTIEAWTYGNAAPKATGSNGPLSRQSNYVLIWDHELDMYRATAALEDGNTFYSAPLGTMQGGQWYLVAATYDGKTLRAYRDGVEVGANTMPDMAPNAETVTAKIGRHAEIANQADHHFDGLIDEVRIDRHAHSASYMLQQYQSMTDQLITYAAEEIL